MLATGLVLAFLALLYFALNLTAMPVVIDVPLGVLAIAGLAAITLLTGLIREAP